jgi:hypothetical protein
MVIMPTKDLCPALAGLRLVMQRPSFMLTIFLTIFALLAGCISNQDDAKPPVASGLGATTSPLASVNTVGLDTLSDSAWIHRLQPEPDGGSVAFLFADPAKGVSRGLGIIEASGTERAQLAWPDSVTSFWWSGPHQLSFTAGTGQGVRVVIDAHAAQLEALEAAKPQASQPQAAQPSNSGTVALSRAQAFIDSVRVQPEGTPQGSALRYQADSIIVAPTDTFAAVHVLANDIRGTKVNPAWYLAHLPSGHMRPIDSLTGRSSGLLSSAGQWGADGVFYYAKERSIWRVQPNAQ